MMYKEIMWQFQISFLKPIKTWNLIKTDDNFKNWLLDNVLFCLYISLQNCMFKLQWCVKLANCNVIEIKGLIFLSFVLFIKMNVKKYDKMLFWKRWSNLCPFPNYLHKPGLVDLISPKIRLDGCEFPHIITVWFFLYLRQKAH